MTGVSDNVKGLCLAISSSVFIGSSFIIKKKGLRKAGTNGNRAGMHTFFLSLGLLLPLFRVFNLFIFMRIVFLKVHLHNSLLFLSLKKFSPKLQTKINIHSIFYLSCWKNMLFKKYKMDEDKIKIKIVFFIRKFKSLRDVFVISYIYI